MLAEFVLALAGCCAPAHAEAPVAPVRTVPCEEVIDHVRSIAVEGPLGPEAIVRLFERIIDEARRLERRVVHGEETV